MARKCPSDNEIEESTSKRDSEQDPVQQATGQNLAPTNSDEPQQIEQRIHTVDIGGGDFRGSSLGPQNYHGDFHTSKQEHFRGSDLRGAHIGPKNIKVVHNTYVGGTEIQYSSPNQTHTEVNKNTDGIFQLTSTISMFQNKPINKRAHIYHGEQRSEVTGSRPLAIKFIPYDQKHANEANLLMRLAYHPNVVSIVHADISHQGPVKFIYIAMELCQEKTLGDYLQDIRDEKISFDPVKMRSLVKQLIEGIVFMHKNGIIHRDLKPDNILFSRDQEFIKIADFGLSKDLSHGRSVTKQSAIRVGTDGYRAPETYTSDVLSQKADIFSLGLVVHSMLTLRHPFGDDPDEWNLNIKKYKNLNLKHLPVKNAEGARDLIRCMLQCDPKQRPTAEQLLMHDLFAKESDHPKPGESSHGIDSSMHAQSNKIVKRKSDKQANKIVVFGHASLFSYKPANKTWRKMKDIHSDLIGKLFSTVMVGERVYVLRGDRSVYQLSMADMTWSRVTDMREHHGSFPSAVALDCSLYIAGGFPTASVESFNPSTNEWKTLDPKRKSQYPVLVALKRKLYCIEGESDSQDISTVERYDPETNVWDDAANTNQAKCRPTAVEFQNVIYVTDIRCPNVVELYNDTTNTWTVINLIGSPSSDKRFFKLVTMNSGIFAVLAKHNKCIIVSLNIAKKKWKVVSKKKSGVIYPSASVVMRI